MRVRSDGARCGGRGLLEVGSGRLDRAARDRLLGTEAGRQHGGKPDRDGNQAADTDGDHFVVGPVGRSWPLRVTWDGEDGEKGREENPGRKGTTTRATAAL